MHTLLGEAEGTTFPADYAAGVDPDDASAALQADWGKTVLRWVPPDQVENLRQVGGLPRVLAGVVAILAVSTLVHTLVTSVRHRRSDLTVLKALGFSRRQVWATVAWQATTLAALALLAGLPLAWPGAAGHGDWSPKASAPRRERSRPSSPCWSPCPPSWPRPTFWPSCPPGRPLGSDPPSC